MFVNVLFFGATADAVGSNRLQVEIDEHSTTTALADQLAIDYPALSNHNLLVAINEEYASSDTLLKNGDEVAIFTAVSGG